MELDTGNYLTQLASVRSHEHDLAGVKNFDGKHLPLQKELYCDHPCQITKENGSKHDMKLLVLLGQSTSENSSYFIGRFSIRMGVDSKEVYWERIKRAKGPGLGKKIKTELLKSAISSSVS